MATTVTRWQPGTRRTRAIKLSPPRFARQRPLTPSASAKQVPPVALRPRAGRPAFGLFFQPAASKQMNLSGKSVGRCLVGVRILSHPKAKPHHGHPMKEAAGSTISGSGAERPTPEPVQRERNHPEILRQVMQKKMYEEWKAATGHPDEAEADSILPALPRSGARRSRMRQPVEGANGAGDYSSTRISNVRI